MARRRMHRETRKFLLALSAVVVCITVVGLGIKWIFSSDPTELTGKTAADLATAGPALQPVASPVTLSARKGSEHAKAGAATPETRKDSAKPKEKEVAPLPAIPKSEAKKDLKPSVPMPPTTQPESLPKITPDQGKKEMEAGFAARDRKEWLAARTHLNNALHSGVPAAQEEQIRGALEELAKQTIFSRSAAKDDPLTEWYTIKSGDSLARIARRNKVSENLLAEINSITNKNVVRVGSKIKVIHGPFNASVIKRDHKLHLYLQDVYIRSFDVALGMDGSTPTGTWKVINHLENPDWVDPNGKRWHANDPDNPIGEFWIGLEGIEGEAVDKLGFGIHGTVDAKTIGQDVSLGCVRLADEDIATVYKLLVPGASIATIAE